MLNKSTRNSAQITQNSVAESLFLNFIANRLKHLYKWMSDTSTVLQSYLVLSKIKMYSIHICFWGIDILQDTMHQWLKMVKIGMDKVMDVCQIPSKTLQHLFIQNSHCIVCCPTTESVQIFRQLGESSNSLSHFHKGWQLTSLSSHSAWHFFLS